MVHEQVSAFEYKCIKNIANDYESGKRDYRPEDACVVCRIT